jgi:circadian clock protein KaiA
LSASIAIAILIESADRSSEIAVYLAGGRFLTHFYTTESEFLAGVESLQGDLDCLILHAERHLLPVVNALYESGTILPVAIVRDEESHSPEVGDSMPAADSKLAAPYLYHPAEVVVSNTHLGDLPEIVDRAIADFLQLAPIRVKTVDNLTKQKLAAGDAEHFLKQQQQRLSDKLKERLGYLAVYYKRKPIYFLRNLAPEERAKVLGDFKERYQQILLDYFQPEVAKVNDRIDELVNVLFIADIAVAEVVEIHMELIEEFAKQLQLENRSEEILQDYRLTLIDIIAHLCEMYRRSIPRELN